MIYFEFKDYILDIAFTPKIAENCREKTFILVTAAVHTYTCKYL